MANGNSRGSHHETSPPDRLRDPLAAYLQSKGKGQNGASGTYRRNAERELRRFAAFLVEQGVGDLEGVGVGTLRSYVRSELLGRDLSPRTVRKYYDYVSAWLGWAQREGIVSEHVGIQDAAREPLPDVDTRSDQRQQSWRSDQRRTLLSFVDDRACEAIERDGLDAYGPVRDRALVSLLAYTGLRGSELLANGDDERRNGATWRDLGSDCKSIQVLGKTQTWETRSVPPQARPPLERWAHVFDPEPEWPIVPTFHYPSLYQGLRDAGHETDDLTGYAAIFEAYRSESVRPSALTTDGARRLMRRLTDDAGVDVEEDYLKLHGARRGVGRVIAMQQGADAAADQLGNSVTVVEERYSDILAAERAEQTGEAFDEHDR